ncbi:MAG: phosphotransferase [Ectothiorhodospiraceae bacterium AqS1]|nr:phosphotransferase [Ectothiorhodospiraceae bacterium AqS1]
MPSSTTIDRSSRRAELIDWLEGILEISSLERASCDASFRSYYRVGSAAGYRIAMDAPPQLEDCRPFVAIRELLERAGLEVPALYAVDIEKGFLLLEDLGDRSYLDILDETNADALYEAAISSIIAMQCGIEASRVPPFDAALLRTELDLFTERFLAEHLGVDLPQERLAAIVECFDDLIRLCLEQPQVFVHRDYHSRNLMAMADDSPTMDSKARAGSCEGSTAALAPGIIDFQDAVAGPITYDAVSLLRDAYIRWPAKRVRHWVDRIHERSVAHGLIAADRARFHRWFDLTGIQRHLKVAGIFARLWHRDAKARYLDDIPPVLAYLAEIAPLYRETQSIARLLEDFDILERTHRARQRILAEIEAGRSA